MIFKVRCNVYNDDPNAHDAFVLQLSTDEERFVCNLYSSTENIIGLIQKATEKTKVVVDVDDATVAVIMRHTRTRENSEYDELRRSYHDIRNYVHDRMECE